MREMAQVDARLRAVQPQAWLDRGVLENHADLVAPLDRDRLARTWIQGRYRLVVAAKCGALAVEDCVRLTGAATVHISRRIPLGTVVAAPAASPGIPLSLPPLTGLVPGLITVWLLFVGIRMWAQRASREAFRVGVDDGRLRNVDASARRLRSRNRGRRWGQILIGLCLITVLGEILLVAREARVDVAGLLTGVVLGAGGLLVLRRCAHPSLTATWLFRHRRRIASPSLRRVASVSLSMILGILVTALPFAGLIGVLLISLVEPVQAVGRFVAYGVVLAVMAGFLLDRAAQRLRARNTHEVLKSDDRPHFLYLRNFGDDAMTVPVSGLARRGPWQILTGWVNPTRTARFEETLARALSRYGPVIAVDPPGSRLPKLGAAKTTLPHNDWQNQVEKWAANAYGVVVSGTPAEINPGLKWELQMIAEHLPHDRILLVLGSWRKIELYHRFAAFLGEVSKYKVFRSLADGWVTDGVLILARLPAPGDGSWCGWGATSRTAWSYTAAIDEAFALLDSHWSKAHRAGTTDNGYSP
ncbi:hypothetical protein [Nonomuraea insulae]|uniref:Uncharacterized protein n=1 Tax=Nonomuraea insulae TaxID=1616787 RepID=A0ABW1D9B3_9ACTN